jgi:hypothetical protein
VTQLELILGRLYVRNGGIVFRILPVMQVGERVTYRWSHVHNTHNAYSKKLPQCPVYNFQVVTLKHLKFIGTDDAKVLAVLMALTKHQPHPPTDQH